METEKNLQTLLKKMEPVLQDGTFVFHMSQKPMQDLINYNPVMLFGEKEGVTCILDKKIADQNGLDYLFVSKMITLNVYSDLESIGFLAVITEHLAKSGISMNAVSAFCHDHVFIAPDRAQQAFQILKEISQNS